MNVSKNPLNDLLTECEGGNTSKILGGPRVKHGLLTSVPPYPLAASFLSQAFQPTSAQAVSQYGGSGGTPFLIYPSIPSSIKVLEIYCAASEDLFQLEFICGLRVGWYIGPNSPLYGRQTKQRFIYTFRPDERVVSMKIAAGVRLDSIEFTTNSGRFRAGGGGGQLHSLDVGSGEIIGFQGRAGWDIGALGIEFFTGKP